VTGRAHAPRFRIRKTVRKLWIRSWSENARARANAAHARTRTGPNFRLSRYRSGRAGEPASVRGGGGRGGVEGEIDAAESVARMMLRRKTRLESRRPCVAPHMENKREESTTAGKDSRTTPRTRAHARARARVLRAWSRDFPLSRSPRRRDRIPRERRASANRQHAAPFPLDYADRIIREDHRASRHCHRRRQRRRCDDSGRNEPRGKTSGTYMPCTSRRNENKARGDR